MDFLPYELLINIYNKVCLDNTPLLNYRVRFINKEFRKIVDNHKNKISLVKKDAKNDMEILYKKITKCILQKEFIILLVKIQ